MPPEIDALTSSTLRHLRERWWNDSFTSFLEESLRPRPGKRILHVGCGDGTGEVSLSRLRLSQIQLFGVDLLVQRLRQAREATRGANARASYAQSDACRLPFRAGVFDSSYCVAVLQHIRDFGQALGEMARVTKPNGRSWSSSRTTPRSTGSVRCRAAWKRSISDAVSSRSAAPRETSPPLRRWVPGYQAFLRRTASNRSRYSSFPVSVAHVGVPEDELWEVRRKAVLEAVADAPERVVAAPWQRLSESRRSYATEARAAGSTFVEIQNTLLVATAGQRAET